MYNGYRVKINGHIVSNNMIAKGSYSQKKADRVIDEWNDADDVQHTVAMKNKRVTITLQLREHDLTEHAAFAALTENTLNVPVEYYDDQTQVYLTGTFRMKEVTFEHGEATDKTIRYSETEIELTEY